MFLRGDAVDDCSHDIEKLNDDNFFVIFNALEQETSFKLPGKSYAAQWQKILNTCNDHFRDEEIYQHDTSIHITGLSIVLLIGLQ